MGRYGGRSVPVRFRTGAADFLEVSIAPGPGRVGQNES